LLNRAQWLLTKLIRSGIESELLIEQCVTILEHTTPLGYLVTAECSHKRAESFSIIYH